LMDIDQHAPNRLLFNALAYQACAALQIEGELKEKAHNLAAEFVFLALDLYADDGYFIEGGGHDTSYQGVAIRIGEDVLLAGYADTNGALRSALSGAANWLADKVGSTGVIDSSDNTRTCWQDELVFGKRKLISVTEIFTGLAYTGVNTENEALLLAASRIERWAKSNKGKNPCFR